MREKAIRAKEIFVYSVLVGIFSTIFSFGVLPLIIDSEFFLAGLFIMILVSLLGTILAMSTLWIHGRRQSRRGQAT